MQFMVQNDAISTSNGVMLIMYQDLSANLKLLCSFYPSIADVCRRLKINRTQFNRYLSGRYKPSAAKMRQLCDFFGVEEYELLLPSAQFARLLQVKPRMPSAVSTRVETEHLEKLHKACSVQINKYLGYYFEYYMSMACPGMILRNLVCIEQQADGVFYQRTERLKEAPDEPAFHSKYLGMVLFLTDRIFMTDYEVLATNEVTQTILTPSYKNRISRLQGLRIGVPANGMRTPSCVRVVLEYLGDDVDVRKALKLCGLYALDDTSIDGSIRQAIQNTIAEGEWHFRAHA